MPDTIFALSSGAPPAAIAIVSANAFDKGLENDVGIAPSDFVLKPVRVSDLLDWLERRLGLQWLEAPRPGESPVLAPSAQELVYPSQQRLRELDELVNLGYFRGIVNLLDRIAQEDAAAAAFVNHMRQLARRFQLESMTELLRKGLHAD